MKKLDPSLKVSESVEINASPKKVWDTLTDPQKIKKYLYDTNTETDWKINSPIRFKGEYQGTPYLDKGTVLENRPYERMEYSYWSGFSGLEDKPENYSKVSYLLEANEDNNTTVLTWKQEGFSSTEGLEHSKAGLPSLLQQIKEISED